MKLRVRPRYLARSALSRLAQMRPSEEVLVLARAIVVAATGFGVLLMETPAHSLPVLWAAFAAYSVGLISYQLRRPSIGKRLYTAALAADLVFLLLLFYLTGGASGPLASLAYLIAATYGLYFGTRIGALAGLATALTVASGGLWSGLLLPWPQVVAQGAVLVAVAAVFGRLGERAESGMRRNGELDYALRREAGEPVHARDRLQDHRQELNPAERLASLGLMSAEIAHQLRDPLSSLSLNLEMLEEELAGSQSPPTAEVADILAVMGRAVENLVSLTENYLQLARLPAPVMRLESLNKLAADVLAVEKPLLQQAGVTCSDILAEGIPEIPFDRRQIRFALENLIQNAREAMPDGGRLRVTTEDGNGFATITVMDTGPGIAPELHEDIFEPFYTTKKQGTGLGLSLARRVVERHSGRLTLSSIVGVGSTFRLSLPVKGARTDD